MSERDFGVGIDLGTSYSAISRVDVSTGRYEFQEAKETSGYREIPSVVFVDTDGSLTFGHTAAQRQNSMTEAGRVLANFKVLLRENRPIAVDGVGPVEPTWLLRGFFAYLKQCYEQTLHMPCSRAVVTVPAHEEFDIDYLARIRQAAMGEDPLFESISTVHEPDAVLLSMGDLSKLYGKSVLVFDMGGGTLDVSIRDVGERDGRPFLTQRAVVGADAAGLRVTKNLANYVLDEWERRQGFTFSAEERATAIRISHLRLDDAKRHLSSLAVQGGLDSEHKYQCEVRMPGRGEGSFRVDVPASKLTDLCREVCEEAIATVEKALARSGMTVADVDEYFIVGGSASLPLMRKMLVDLFDGKAPSPLMGAFGNVDPTLAVCRGAAIEDLDREDSAHVPDTTPVLERRIPYAISLVVDRRRATNVLIPADETLPYGPVQKTFYVPADGDECVSIEIVRGTGDPQACVPFDAQEVWFPRPQSMGTPFEISWYIDGNGELTVTAFDKEGRELGVIRRPSLLKEIA